ncbi:MAG: RNA polymerase sigma factor [Ktedonobacterales bacterium]
MTQETTGVQIASASELVLAARARLAAELQELPGWDTPQLWARVYSPVPHQAVSFGALVHLIRVALRRNEGRTARELFVLLLERTEGLNRRWAEQAVRRTPGLRGPAGLVVREDLRQELTLRLWESVALGGGEAWELFFQRSLAYAQRHTAISYMEQRGYWNHRTTAKRAGHPIAASISAHSTLGATSGTLVAEDMWGRRGSDVGDATYEVSMLRALDIAAPGGDFAAADLTDLRELVTRLPREQRIAVVLRHWQQASEAEIAETLGVTTRTVRNYLQRAHQRLRMWYEGTEALI